MSRPGDARAGLRWRRRTHLLQRQGIFQPLCRDDAIGEKQDGRLIATQVGIN